MAAAVIIALAGLCVPLYFLPKPLAALRNYLVLLPFLPEFLVVDAGVSITGSRVSTLVFLLALVYRATDRLLPRWDRMDVALAGFLGLYLLAVVPGPPGEGWVFAAGFLVDVALPYYFVRCLVRTTAELEHLVRALLLPAGIVVVLAAFQSLTGFGLFDALKTGDHVFGAYDSGMKRLGLTRADVGLTHYIMMGLWFACLMPIAIGHHAGRGVDFGRILPRVLHFVLGAFFSLSGGAFVATGIGLGAYAAWPLRRIWPLLLALGLLAVAYIETFSNRGTLAIIATFAATDGDSAWYRIRLPAAVFDAMAGHWWSGFGRNKPPMGIYNDITNHYLWWLMQSGLPGMVAFVACFGVAFQRLYRSTQQAVAPYLVSLNWGIGAAILALGLGLLTVSVFGQMRTYMFLFFALSACSFAAARDERQHAGALARVEPWDPVPATAT